ncbi:MAG: four helix bundle protein [Marinoscillum sp.]|uniref:four helix bundle protein n=1 Tax=Marinoscillum sp. TaxID=2024838 RepID=UPI003302F06B
MIKSYKDLEVYSRSFKLAMDIFWMSKDFPKEEIYSLTSQIVRSSRSVSSNIVEGWAKRNYEAIFKQHLITSLGSNAETENWLTFALKCQYISQEAFDAMAKEIDEIGKMLTTLHQNWKSHGK